MKVFLETIRKNKISYTGFFTFFIIITVALSVCDIVVTKLTGEMSQASLGFDVDVLLHFLIIMAAVVGIKAIFAALSAIFTGRFTGKTAYNLRKGFAEHFTYMYFADFERKSSGSMLSLYANDLPLMVNFITNGSLSFISGIISVMASSIYMATISPIYTVVFFLMFPILILIQVKISTPIQKKAIEMSAARAGFNEIVLDSLQNPSTIISNSLETVMEQRYLSSYDKFYKAMQDYLSTLVLLVISGIVATMLPIAFIYAAAGLGVVDEAMSISEFIAFTTVASVAGNWLSMLSQNLRTIWVNYASASRVHENMKEPIEDLASGVLVMGDNDIAISFENVSFSYKDDCAPVLKNLSFKIKRGTKTAIIGESGSGKSTILKLLLALYEPNDGSIYISGQSLCDMPKSSLRNQLAYVPQDCFLFPEPIRENLTCGRNISEEQLTKACEGAGILDFINSLPNGFDTVLSESAENISGGQRQRLAITRAFLQDAPIVLFDEATSSLDPITENEVLKSFNTLMKDKTVIMVSHRLTAVGVCDNVIKVGKGGTAND